MGEPPPPLYEESQGLKPAEHIEYQLKQPEAEDPPSASASASAPALEPFRVRPDLANISNGPNSSTRPEYATYMQREEYRRKNGDAPRDRSQFKHGAPLNPGHTGGQGLGSGAFPGKAGATYHGAANR